MCSVTCFNGIENGSRQRYRECINGKRGDIGCIGIPYDEQECTDLDVSYIAV